MAAGIYIGPGKLNYVHSCARIAPLQTEFMFRAFAVAYIKLPSSIPTR